MLLGVGTEAVGGSSVCTDVDTSDCTQGLNEHQKRICTANLTPGRKITCLAGGIEPASVLRLAFRSDALPTRQARSIRECGLRIRRDPSSGWPVPLRLILLYLPPITLSAFVVCGHPCGFVPHN